MKPDCFHDDFANLEPRESVSLSDSQIHTETHECPHCGASVEISFWKAPSEGGKDVWLPQWHKSNSRYLK